MEIEISLMKGVVEKMLIETERLLLREYTLADYDALFEIVSDAETMQHYPAPFDEERTRGWISWNMDNYEKYGFGLWVSDGKLWEAQTAHRFRQFCPLRLCGVA